WLTEQVNSDRAFGVSPLVLSSVVRIATNRRVFSPLATALAYCDQLRNLPQAVVVREGPRHWEIFIGLCGAGGGAHQRVGRPGDRRGSVGFSGRIVGLTRWRSRLRRRRSARGWTGSRGPPGR